MNLTRELKLRVDEDLYEKISELSEKEQRTKSWIMRDFITRFIAQTVPDEM